MYYVSDYVTFDVNFFFKIDCSLRIKNTRRMCSFKFIEKVKKIKESNPNIFSEEDNKYVSDWEKNEKYNKECPDIYAGYIKDGECTVWFGKQYRDDHKKDLDNTKEEEGMKNIVVILESPHTDEYKDSNFIHPALGKTRKNLQKYFQNLVYIVIKRFKSQLGDGTYKIILMESIPYQCSLGINPLNHKIRDKIFLELWKDEKIHKFSERIKSYNPVAIFNCCTKGDEEQELRTLVQDKINEYKKGKNDIELYKCSHPSLWNFSIDKAE